MHKFCLKTNVNQLHDKKENGTHFRISKVDTTLLYFKTIIFFY